MKFVLLKNSGFAKVSYFLRCCFQSPMDKTNIVIYSGKKLIDSEQLGNREPFSVITLLVYFIIREQPSIIEQFCHDQKVPCHQVWLYKIRISV